VGRGEVSLKARKKRPQEGNGKTPESFYIHRRAHPKVGEGGKICSPERRKWSGDVTEIEARQKGGGPARVYGTFKVHPVKKKRIIRDHQKSGGEEKVGKGGRVPYNVGRGC